MKFLLLKVVLSQMEDDVHENKKNISTIYKMMEQNKDLVNHSNHMSDVVNTENISEVISGVGQAVPSANIKTNQNTEKQQQNTDNIYLFNKDKMCNVNQNYAVLDRPLFPSLTNSHTHSPKSSNVTMKPQLYEGDEDLNEYLAQFEILAEINGWNYATKSLYLAGSLKGGAKALLNELDKESRKDYDSLVKVLDNRYGSAEKSELFRAKLQTRMRGKEESLPELAQSIKKLTRQAYPSAPSTITSVLALEHFIDALPDADLRLRLRESNPKSIHEAETLAVRLETLKLAERQKGRMVRQADTVHNENNTINTELNNDKGEDFKSLRHELSDFKKELVSLTRDIKGKPVEVGLRGRSQAKSEWPKSLKINESLPLANNEGLFVRAKINDKYLAFLVDTGANVTILSKKFIDEINPSLLPKINPVNINLITATGDSAPFIGQVDVEICLGDHIYYHNVLVADISNEGIIGMDFLVTHDCDVLLSQNKLKIKGEIIQCFHYASSAKSCYRVAIQETVNVPPNSEMIVSGESNEPIFRGLAGLIEPNEKFMEKNGLLVARSIVHPEMYNIPLRIINMNNEPCTLYKGTIIATCNKINEEDIQTFEFVNNVAGGQATINKGRQLPDYLHEVFESSEVNLDKDQSEKFKDLLMEYSNIFSKSSEDIGLTDLVEHTINTGNHPPVRQRPRRIPLARMKDPEAEIQKMVQQDIIEPSSSPWNSNIVLVKKSDDSWRFCIDFRSVKLLVLRPSYPLPRIDDTIDSLSGSKFFSTVDLKSGYYQIPVAKEDRPKTAFSFPGGGLWQFKRIPMGLCNSTPVFERLMETVLSGLTWQICLVYLDDVIIFSKSFEEHMKNLKEVFQRLKAANLKLNPKKCNFLKTEVKFLGHIVSESGVATDPNKIQSVKDWPVPKSIKDVRSFLGLTSYYRKFILIYADKAKPLYKVTEKNQKFVWTDDCQQSFEELKNTLISAPILAYPTREDLFILDTDASNVGMGAVLSQLQDGVEKKLRELLAVVASIKHFHHYLYGKHFKVRSDHGALSWLFNVKNPEGQLARWFEVLASYDFKIEHRAVRSHNNADALSRRPCYNKKCPHCARAEINYELVPNHKNVLTVEKCNDNVTVSESCRNVQDVSDKQSVTTTSISCINEDRPNMTGDETCHKVKSHVIHNKFKSKGPDKNPDVFPVQYKIVRVCTRSKDYGCSQNEKDNPVKEINFENVSESQLSDDVISIIIQWKIDEVKPIWADVSHMSPEVKFYWSRLNSLILVNGILYRKWESYNGNIMIYILFFQLILKGSC
ncbi:unnamed protein product [Mytilus coruscus]|uniref:RNA-directed DNA polymerase n=1 Tax=Mytilus coruscus TaxID=42192 RepID=A0A6J8BTC5_MYTCO|nr:unnamed protein product [Mytilus coruscus]